MRDTRDSHLLLLGFFVWKIVVTYVLLPVMFEWGWMPDSTTVMVVWHLAVFAVPLLAAWGFARVHGRVLVALRRPDAGLVLLSVFMGITIRPLGAVISFLTNIAGVDDSVIEGFTQIIVATPLPLSLLFLAVMPSLTEELMFRGAISSGYRGVPVIKAALVNGVLFGLMHGNARQFFYAAMLGTLIAMVVIRAGSVLYGIIMHFVINGVQVLVTAFTADTQLPDISTPQAPLFMTLGIMAIIATLIYHRLYLRFKARCQTINPITNQKNTPIHTTSLITVVFVGLLLMFS